MVRYEILVDINGVRKQLDTYDFEPISLTYNIADIADITSRNSSFSKTIKLPESKENRQIFGDISELGVDSTFNPNKKSKAFILCDTVVIFEGYLQLRNVITNLNNDKVEYEVVIFGDFDNFIKELGDKDITDINFGELSHMWSMNNIVNSWTQSYSHGYYYPLIDYGYDLQLSDINIGPNSLSQSVSGSMSAGNMFPATSVKYIWNKIFTSNGWTYQSDFLNTDLFNNLYIPFNRKSITRGLSSSLYRFSIGMTQSTTISTTASINIPKSVNDPPFTYQQNLQPVQLIRTRYPFDYEGSPYGDPNNYYDTSTHIFTTPTDFVSGRFVCDFNILFRFPFNPYTSPTSICFKRSMDINGNPVLPTTVNHLGGEVIPNMNGLASPMRFTNVYIPGIAVGTTMSNTIIQSASGQISTVILSEITGSNRKLFPNEQVWVEFNYSSTNIMVRDIVGDSNLLPPTEIVGTYSFNTTLATASSCGTYLSGRFFDVLNENVLLGELIDYNNILPLNFKQKDFITSIIKMFNLYIEPSKDYNKYLLIEPRDDYYQNGEIKNWTKKLDINNDINIQILGETQNKKTIFKYKDDKDFYNTDYKDKFTTSYGEYDYYLDNDFVSNIKTIETGFSPTPISLVGNSDKIIIPVIAKSNNNIREWTETLPRILSRSTSSTETTWLYQNRGLRTSGVYVNYFTLTGTQSHPYSVGDTINIIQTTNNNPALNRICEIVEVVDNLTIVVDILYDGFPVLTGISGGTVIPKNGLLSTGSNNSWCLTDGSTYQRLYGYPYLGHFDNPLRPTHDLNFGQTTGLYFTQQNVTTNNLYNSYYKNMMNELSNKNSRIISASFYLTPADIATFKFSDSIFIKDEYFKVNKIEGYDPTKEGLCNIQLIKSQYYKIPKTRKDMHHAGIGGTLWDSNTLTPGTNTGIFITNNTNILSNLYDSAILGSNNTIGGSNQVVIGQQNEVSGNNNLISGDSNQIDSTNGGLLVVGDRNASSSEKSAIIGDTNTIGSNSEKTVLIGQDNIVSDNVTRSFIFGNDNRIVCGSTQSLSNVICIGNSMSVSDSNTINIGIGSNILQFSATSSTILGSFSAAGVDGDIQINSGGVLGVPYNGRYLRFSDSWDFGLGCTVSGTSFAIGINNNVTNQSFSIGQNNIVSGLSSYAEGNGNTASGQFTHAEGYGNIASATTYGSHAEGYYTIASANGSHSEGGYTIASGNYSHTEGGYTIASGSGAHAEGRYSQATTDGAHAEGFGTVADGDYSHSSGVGSKAVDTAEYVCANGFISVTGDSQYRRHIGKTITTDENKETILSITLQDDTIITGQPRLGIGYCVSGTTSYANDFVYIPPSVVTFVYRNIAGTCDELLGFGKTYSFSTDSGQDFNVVIQSELAGTSILIKAQVSENLSGFPFNGNVNFTINVESVTTSIL